MYKFTPNMGNVTIQEDTVATFELLNVLGNQLSCSSRGSTLQVCDHDPNVFSTTKTVEHKIAQAFDTAKQFYSALKLNQAASNRALNAVVLCAVVRLAAYHLTHARAYRSPRRSSNSISTNGGDDSGGSDPDQSDPPLRPYLYQSLTPKLYLNSLSLAVAVTCSRQMSRWPSEGRLAA